MRSLLSVLGLAGLMYLGLCVWVYVTQRAQMYFPTPEATHPGAKVLWVGSDGERIKVWAVRRSGPRALMYFGGNAEDVAASIDSFAAAFPAHSLFLVNYRGYGGSSGRPSETAFYSDARNVYDRVASECGEISVMERSLGSGVAMHLATERPVAHLVLVTSFDRMVKVAKSYFWWLPVGLLMRDRYELAMQARRVAAPVLVVTAGEDEIIPAERSQALVKAFAQVRVQHAVIPGVGHNTLDVSPKYLESVRAFLAYAPGLTEG